MSVDLAIRTAIAEHRLMRCVYGGQPRIFEPHVYGRQGGVLRLQAYQTGGASGSGRLPDWRLFTVEKMQRVECLNELFPGPRPVNSRSSRFDQILVATQAKPMRRDPVPELRNIARTPTHETPHLPAVRVEPSFIRTVLSTTAPANSMLDSGISQTVSRTIERRLPQLRREFAEATEKDEVKNASMGRHGGIALHFPMQTAEREIERRVDFAWEHIKAILAAGGVNPSPTLVEDVRVLLTGIRDSLLGDIEAKMAQIASRNSSDAPAAQLDARWKEGLARALSAAEVYALALKSREEGKVTGPPSVTLSGTVHAAIFQYGPNATANTTQSISGSDLESLVPLLEQLAEEVRAAMGDARDTQVAVSAIEKVRDDAVAKRITVGGLTGALTFVLGTWQKLRTLGALVPLRAWLTARGISFPPAAE